MVALGDEAIAMGALHAGISAAYGYPGTPSTEIIEHLQKVLRGAERPVVRWCANEKTAYEDALGTAYAGRRALVTMKHVGLNVAMDPFVNSSLLDIGGGLVILVADDPGMHSSQDEQDSRLLADFAHVPFLEPRSQQECYEMAREAFDISERHRVPVLIRVTTRLAHSRAIVRMAAPRAENPLSKASDKRGWMLLPATARRNWRLLLDKQEAIAAEAESSPYNELSMNPGFKAYGVVTAGLARNYYEEVLPELPARPSHLHIGRYPVPMGLIRKLAAGVEKLIFFEEGWPYAERMARGVFGAPVAISGRMDGLVPPDGELDPDVVRKALGLPAPESAGSPPPGLAGRPPQLCQGCPHADSFNALNEALAGYAQKAVTSDIGCYALGALPPFSAIETIVCMGASVGMAKGAAEAGLKPAVAVLGDSTFLHSGLPSLLDIVDAKAPATVLVLDNGTVGMTGGQRTIAPGGRIADIAKAIGVEPEHVVTIEAHKRNHQANVEILKREIAYEGPSVVIAVRECLETIKRKPKAGCEE
jgi:indolepyruvate ferredoxin oxidoreductase alpha subunit